MQGVMTLESDYERCVEKCLERGIRGKYTYPIPQFEYGD
jgi:hypothetical protein